VAQRVDMIELGASFAMFGLLWLCHVLWFRVRPPRRRLQALLRLFAAGFVVLAIGCAWAAGHGAAGQPFIRGTSLPLTAVALYVLLSLAYVIVYTAVEVDSPSALIALRVSERGDEGMTDADLRDVLTDDALVLARLRDLVAAGSVSRDGTQYRLEPRGVMIARVFEAYRAVLGRGLGG
jgi:hypothetical protein